jgi:hypothetical protein
MTVNPLNGAVVKKSDIKQIREKTIYPLGTGFVAVCGVNDKHSAVKLCLIDEATLEIKKESSETLSENTSLILQGDSFYAIVSDEKKNYLASFDKDLNLKKKSDVAINGSSPLNFYSEGIIVTDEKGKPVLLSVPALTPVWNGTSSADAK